MLYYNTLIIAIMTKFITLMKVLKLMSYTVWHALHRACLYLKTKSFTMKFRSSNQCPLNLLRNIGLWNPGVPYTEHFENWDKIVHCITQCFVYKTTAVVLKTANGNLGKKTDFTLYLTLSNINIQGHRHKFFQGGWGQRKNKTKK